MNKKLLKTLTGLAIVGTALGAAFAYIKKCKEVNELGEEDFDDLWDGEEENPEVSSCTPCRSYTTIPSDSPVPEDEKHIEESEEEIEDENGNKKKLYIVSKSFPYLTKLFNDIESWVNKD